MKNTLSLLLITSSLFANTSVEVKSGWNFLGSLSNITPSQIECAKTVWTYKNGGWNLYVKNGPTDNYNFPLLDMINTANGFWVNATESCNIEFDTVTYTSQDNYFTYGLNLYRYTNGDKYNVSNSLGTNNISLDENTNTFTLNAYKDEGKDSRSQLVIQDAFEYPLQSVQTTLKMQTDGTTNENRAQLNVGKFSTLQNLGDAEVYTGLLIKGNGVGLWYEISYPDGSYKELYSYGLTNENMNDKLLTPKIKVNGTKIIYSVDGDVSFSHTLDTANLEATIDSGIKYAIIRSRVKDDTSSSTAANSTHVDVNDIQVEYSSNPYLQKYFLNGRIYVEKNTDERYRVSNQRGNNGIQIDKSNGKFYLRSYKEDKKDSRTGIIIPQLELFPASSVQAKVKLLTTGNNHNNRAQLIAGKFDTTQHITGENYNTTAGINMAKTGIYFWYDKDYEDGSYEELLWEQASSNDVTNIKIYPKIEVNGTKIIFSVWDLDNEVSLGYREFDTNNYASQGATIASNIKYSELRSRTKDNNTTNYTGSFTEVELSNIYANRNINTFNAYGIELYDRRDKARYLISNSLGTNSIDFNASSSTFNLSAYKEEGVDSQTGLKLDKNYAHNNPKSSIEVDVKLTQATTNDNKGQINLWYFGIDEDSELEGGTGIVLNKTGAYVWYTTENMTTYESTSHMYGHQIASGDMTGKNVKTKISVNGSKIIYNLSGDISATFTYDTASTGHTINTLIRSLEIKARNDNENVSSSSGDVTKVEVSNITLID